MSRMQAHRSVVFSLWTTAGYHLCLRCPSGARIWIVCAKSHSVSKGPYISLQPLPQRSTILLVMVNNAPQMVKSRWCCDFDQHPPAELSSLHHASSREWDPSGRSVTPLPNQPTPQHQSGGAEVIR
ncbi:hypothetical protein FRC03_001621 [Tulasnella sp. 419]|nr:hypothetical protein FRC03_001621 [Tulasnella sp. 419]